MRRHMTAVLCVSLVLALAGAVFAQAAESAPAQAPAEAPAEQAGGQGLSGAVGQVNAVAAAIQAQAQAQRLAVLERVRSGELTAQQGLDELDKLPTGMAAYETGQPRAWLVLNVRQQGKEISAQLPLALVQWVVGEGPKLAPKELLKAKGVDLGAADFQLLAATIGSLAYVTEPTTLLEVEEEGQDISIMVEPAAGAEGR